MAWNYMGLQLLCLATVVLVIKGQLDPNGATTNTASTTTSSTSVPLSSTGTTDANPIAVLGDLIKAAITQQPQPDSTNGSPNSQLASGLQTVVLTTIPQGNNVATTANVVAPTSTDQPKSVDAANVAVNPPAPSGTADAQPPKSVDSTTPTTTTVPPTPTPTPTPTTTEGTLTLTPAVPAVTTTVPNVFEATPAVPATNTATPAATNTTTEATPAVPVSTTTPVVPVVTLAVPETTPVITTSVPTPAVP